MWLGPKAGRKRPLRCTVSVWMCTDCLWPEWYGNWRENSKEFNSDAFIIVYPFYENVKQVAICSFLYSFLCLLEDFLRKLWWFFIRYTINTTIVKYSLKRDNWIVWIRNITKHNYVNEFYKPRMTNLHSLGINLANLDWFIDLWYKDLDYWPKSYTFWK